MMLSPAGVLSGTSGKQKTTQEWISAKLNCPTRLSLFIGLCDGQRQEQEKNDRSRRNMSGRRAGEETLIPEGKTKARRPPSIK